MTVTPNICQTLLWGDGTPGGPALTYPEAEPASLFAHRLPVHTRRIGTGP
jgi:hypothetical protein